MKPTTVPMTRSHMRRSPEQWRELFTRFEQSGQTRERFCAEQGLALSSFDRWRHKLRHDVPRGEAVVGDALFVELTSDGESSAKAPWDVELQLGGGMILRLRRPC